MWKYVLKRVGLAFVTMFIILSLTFILMKLLPFQKPLGNDRTQFSYYMNQVSLGYVMDSRRPIKALGDALFEYTDGSQKKHYFYVMPVMQQYGAWLKGIFTQWNWGTSVYIKPNVSAIAIIGERLPISMSFNILSVIFSVPLGILLGVIAALKKNKPTDHIISTGVMIFISIPGFVMITLLIYVLGYVLNWLPPQYPSPTAPVSQKILGYFIPVISLSFGSICGYARFTRAELCEVMSSEYLLLARTKGLTKRQAILRHALRNAMVPIIPSILAEFIGIMSGSMILENLYGIPGIGDLFVSAMSQKDYNVLFVDMAIFTTISLLAGVVLDISYGFIDPRIRMGAKK
ncbi:MAG: ABC transporter permease [Anaeroplasmataceae bacterium]|nr:ABC transporter permease [Anaeroplasmataceae bacterium]MDE6242026.1 ABC transporter permease [Anaeroplasmataceae bacterium]